MAPITDCWATSRRRRVGSQLRVLWYSSAGIGAADHRVTIGLAHRLESTARIADSQRER
jgi:hypothetical protein